MFGLQQVKMPGCRLILFALAIRLFLIYLSRRVSDPPALSMTDIDYLVIMDGVCLVPAPSARPTYRYSPLLKVVLKPMCHWPEYGKALYGVLDVVTAWMIWQITGNKTRVTWLWLLNPLIVALSTRGSFESLVQALLCGSILLLRTNKYGCAGLLLGLCMHLRLYPVVLLPFFSLYVLVNESCRRSKILAGITRSSGYTMCVIGAFLACVWLSTILDSGYMETGLLYHISGRVDHRHNLSIFWASQLACSKGQEPFCKPYAKVCQCVALATIAAKRITTMRTRIYKSRKDRPYWSKKNTAYPLAHLIADIDKACRVFVAFNSVVTAQYFSWGLATLAMTGRKLNLQTCLRITIFVLGLGTSLATAGMLEFSGQASHLSLITVANTLTMGAWLAF